MPPSSTNQRTRVRKPCWRSRSYSSVKAELLSSQKWGKLLLDCLERGTINSRLVTSFLSRTFRWADRKTLLNSILDEKESLENIRTKVDPYDYLKYLDEVFTHLLLSARRHGSYQPMPVTPPQQQAYDKIIVAMLIEEGYVPISQILNL